MSTAPWLVRHVRAGRVARSVAFDSNLFSDCVRASRTIRGKRGNSEASRALSASNRPNFLTDRSAYVSTSRESTVVSCLFHVGIHGSRPANGVLAARAGHQTRWNVACTGSPRIAFESYQGDPELGPRQSMTVMWGSWKRIDGKKKGTERVYVEGIRKLIVDRTRASNKPRYSHTSVETERERKTESRSSPRRGKLIRESGPTLAPRNQLFKTR